MSGVDFTQSERTLVIAMSANCHFCTESLPFYNDLARTQREVGDATRIVAVFPEEERVVEQYAKQHGFEVSTIAGVNLSGMGISGTPTMILLDQKGKVLDFWTGKPSTDTQQQVAKAITLRRA